jgi:hypothetical protein
VNMEEGPGQAPVPEAAEASSTTVTPTTDADQGDVYGPSTVKRKRRTNTELEALNSVIIEVVSDDHPMTVRGVYYRVLSLGLVEKSENHYRLVTRQLLKLRRTGRIPYPWITDGTRWIRKPDSFSDIDEMLSDAAASYRRALWHDQDASVEVYSEKDAIAGLLYEVTAKWDVPLGVLRGYASESFAFEVGDAIARDGRPAFVYHFGDHDPSGVDQFRDFEKKVRSFAPEVDVEFIRAAVTVDQIEEYGLPTRPTKKTDTRAKAFAGRSVEVDAVPPSVLRELVEECITRHIDSEALRLTRVAEDSEREILSSMIGGDQT